MQKILIIDDDLSLAKDISDILLQEGYHPEISRDGGEGIEKIKKENYQLVLLDMIMPGLHGIDVLNEIKRMGKSLKVIMLATPLEKVLVEKALELGANDFIRKPIDVEELMKKVKAHLQEVEVFVEEERFEIEKLLPEIYQTFADKSVKTEKEALDMVVDAISKIVNAERVSVTLIEKDTGFLKPIAMKGFELKEEGPFMKVGEGIAGKVALTGESILVKDIREMKELPRSTYGYHYKTHSFICVPIKVRGEVIGVISVNDKITGAAFDEEDLNALLKFSTYVSTIIEDIVLHKEIEKLRLKKKTVERIISLLLSGMEPAHIYKGFSELVKEITGASIFWVVVEEPGTGDFYIDFADGVECSRTLVKGIYKGLTGKVLYSKSSVSSREVKEGFSESELPFAFKIKEWIGASILLRGRHIGAIFAANKRSGSFTKDDLENLSFISSFVGIALKEFWLHDNLVKTLEELASKELEIEELKGKIPV